MKLFCRLCNSGFHVAITALPVDALCPACTAKSSTNPNPPKKRARRDRRKKG